MPNNRHFSDLIAQLVSQLEKEASEDKNVNR